MADNRLVLITGAGATRNLGADDLPMPLMYEWAKSVRITFDKAEPGLADALGLNGDLSGEQFEKTLGEYLAWEQTLPLQHQFRRLGAERNNKLQDRGDYQAWHQLASERAPMIRRALNTWLWEDFNLERIDRDAAHVAYGRLGESVFAALPAPNTEIFSATTNYDRSGESAWESLGYRCDTGARGGGARTSILRVGEIEPWGDHTVIGHLHLHGAVGWYRQEGAIRVEPADRRYDDRETPAVLYPDPQKDPFAEGGWGADTIWQKLVEALQQATHVLVLGHSLHDRPLVEALDELIHQGHRPRLGFCYHTAEHPSAIGNRIRTARLFGGGMVDLSLIPMDFGPDADFEPLQRWILGATIQPTAGGS